MQKSPMLSERLHKISELIPYCECFADIGTDHAYLPVYLCCKNICKFAIASDINEGPLKRAEKTIISYDMRNRISLRLGGGFEKINKNEVQAVSVAGMGGLVIANILEAGREKISSECTLVLQPMTAVKELREYLCQNGWVITEEALACEDDKIYNIISVKRNDEYRENMTEAELYIGKYLAKYKPVNYDKYIEKKIKKLKNMIAGLENSNSEQSKEKHAECIALLHETEKMR